MGREFSCNMTPIEDASYHICEVVSKKFKFVFNAFIPVIIGAEGAWFDGPKSITEHIQNAIEFTDEHAPHEWIPQYKSDHRPFFQEGPGATSRIHFEAGFEIAIGRFINIDKPKARCDATWKRIKHIDLRNGNYYSNESTLTAVPSADIKENHDEKLCHIEATISAHDPFFSSLYAPDIDIYLCLDIRILNSETIEVSLNGRHDKYPAYEAYVQKNDRILHKIWFYDPAQHNELVPGLINLTNPQNLQSENCKQAPKAPRKMIICEPIKTIIKIP